MKKLLLQMLFLTAYICSDAQGDIRLQILSYNDSTEIMIRNGRQLLVDQTLSGKHQAALKTLNYLKENIDERYAILTPVEELIFSLSTRNFPLFLYNARNFNTLTQSRARMVFHQNMHFELQDYLINEMPFIIEDLDKNSMHEEDKEIIRFYIRYYMAENLEELQASIKRYQKEHPDSEYQYFLNELKSQTLTGRINFNFGYGNEFLDGAIAETFTDRFHVMSMEIDAIINKLYLSIFFSGSISKIQSNIDLPVKDNDVLHSKDEKVSSMKFGLKIGRVLYSKPGFNFYPYLTIGGYEMNSQSSAIRNNNSSVVENTLTSSFMTGVGAAGDIIIKRWQPQGLYNSSGYWFLRPQIGYDRFLSSKAHTNGSDFYFMISTGIGLGSF